MKLNTNPVVSALEPLDSIALFSLLPTVPLSGPTRGTTTTTITALLLAVECKN